MGIEQAALACFTDRWKNDLAGVTSQICVHTVILSQLAGKKPD
jgi:hypothetical protein